MANIYFITNSLHVTLKIGVTKNNPQKRLKECQVGNAQKLVLLGWIPENQLGVTAQEFENMFKKRFKAYQIRGEWYDYSNAIKDFLIKKLLEKTSV